MKDIIKEWEAELAEIDNENNPVKVRDFFRQKIEEARLEVKEELRGKIKEIKESGAKDKELFLQERSYNKALEDILKLIK